MYLWIILLTVLSAILYRLGGWGGEGRARFPNVPGWVFDTKARDVGCALCVTGGTFIVGIAQGIPVWAHIVAFLLLFGALTTYWDEVFGYDNFWAHGFACGMALLPLAIANPTLLFAVGIRALVMALMMGIICKLSGNDFVEEFGRGSALTITLPLLLVHL